MRAFLGPKYREIHDQSLDITCMVGELRLVQQPFSFFFYLLFFPSFCWSYFILFSTKGQWRNGLCELNGISQA